MRIRYKKWARPELEASTREFDTCIITKLI